MNFIEKKIEEFENRFKVPSYTSKSGFEIDADFEVIKSFLRSALKEQTASFKKQVEKMKEDASGNPHMKISRILDGGERLETIYRGYNAALTDVVALIEREK